MEFAILGPLRVVGPDGPIELGRPSSARCWRRCCSRGGRRRCRRTRLIDVLWGEDPPATAAKALQVHVSRLRHALGPGDPIVTRASGYAVVLEPGAARPRALRDAAARAREHAAGPSASRLLGEALALFRGPPLADAPLLGPAESEASRLGELRLAVLEERIDADLALGRHAALVGELEALAAEHPYRERLHAQLMLALYRSRPSGRRARGLRRVRACARRGARARPGPRAAAPRGRDPRPGPGARPAAPAARAGARADPPPLPVPMTPLLGREEDIEAAAALLAEPGVRPAHRDRPGRDRQDAARARAGAPARAALRGRRALRAAGGDRRAGARRARARPGARRGRGRGRERVRRARRAPRRPLRRCSSSTTSSRCSTPRRTSRGCSPPHRGSSSSSTSRVAAARRRRAGAGDLAAGARAGGSSCS